MDTKTLALKIKNLLDDKKGEDIICYNISEKSTIADYMIIATGIELVLVGKLGFSIDDKYVKRAAMDYWHYVNVTHIKTIDEYLDNLTNEICAISTKGHKLYTDISIKENKNIDIVFGSEGAGLPKFMYEKYSENLYRIPMKEGLRSLNLSSSVAVVAYHMLHKLNFPNIC